MERHVIDHSRSTQTGRLPRYVGHERLSRVRGPHHAINVLRRLPRGSGDPSRRMQVYLQMARRRDD